MWFWHCWRPHWLRSRSHFLASCSSTLWRGADSVNTISPRSLGLVWLICSSCSSSRWKAFQLCSGETKSRASCGQQWRERLLSWETHACFAFITSFKNTPNVSCCLSPVFVLQCNMDHANQLLSRWAAAQRLPGSNLFPNGSVEKVSLCFFFCGSKKESHLLKGLVWTHQFHRHILIKSDETWCEALIPSCAFSLRPCWQKAWTKCRTTVYRQVCWTWGASLVCNRSDKRHATQINQHVIRQTHQEWFESNGGEKILVIPFLVSFPAETHRTCVRSWPSVLCNIWWVWLHPIMSF